MEEQKFVDQYPHPPHHFADVLCDAYPSISELHEEDIYNGKYSEKDSGGGNIRKDVLKKKVAIYMETALTLLNTQPKLSQQGVELQVIKLENSLVSLYETIKLYRQHQGREDLILQLRKQLNAARAVEEKLTAALSSVAADATALGIEY